MGRTANTARRVRPTVPSKMTVAQLREELRSRGLDTTGAKAALTARLKRAMDDAQAPKQQQQQQSNLRATRSAPDKPVSDAVPQLPNQVSKESRSVQTSAAPTAESSEQPLRKEPPATTSATTPVKTTVPAQVTSAPLEEVAVHPSNASAEAATGTSSATEDASAAKGATGASAKETSAEQCEDPMSESRRRRRAERFGIEYKPFERKEASAKSESAKEEANGAESSAKRKLPDTADEEARQKRAERFGIVDKPKENKKTNASHKVDAPAAVPPDELERRAKRAKRFAMA